jgi:hypothetical protein
LKGILSILKSKNKYEKAEGYCILILVAGGLILSLGIGLTIINTKGISAILAMSGALISFLATIGLIVVWLIQELIGD